MTTRLEHANLAVRDIDEAIRFVRTAFPEFRIRGEGKSWQGWRWVHVGTYDVYLALNEAPQAPAERWVSIQRQRSSGRSESKAEKASSGTAWLSRKTTTRCRLRLSGFEVHSKAGKVVNRPGS